MDTRQVELWARLESFQFDPPDAELTFVQRLARECGWSRSYAQEVVHEYRRFLLLAVSAGHPVTPSEEVDQAWHLHLAYSVSYWEELCRGVLARPLHHGPTRGGGREATKYRDWYARTLASYERVFGAPAPAHIWPPAERRFANATRFRHVDTRAYWLLPRRGITRGALALATMAAASCALNTDVGTSGGEWAVLVVIVVVAWVVKGAKKSRSTARRNRRKDSSDGSGCSALGCGFSTGCGSDSSAGAGDSGCGASGCGGGGCGGD